MLILPPFTHEIGWFFGVSEASQSHIACVLGAGWPQDVANSWKNLKTYFRWLILPPFWHSSRWGVAVSEASQRHIACVLGAGWPQDEANSWKKLTVSFSRVSEEMLAARYGKQLEKAENYQFL